MLPEQAGKIWIDGKLVDSNEATIHILTHTLHYGSGVFEGERAYNGVIFKMQEHHERLHASANMLGIEVPYTVPQLNDAAEIVIKVNGYVEAYVRPVVWHGPESLSVSSSHNKVHVAIAAWKWPSYFQPGPDGKISGIKLMWSDWVRPAPTMGPVHAKANGQYITGMMSKNKAEKNGYHDALMLDYRGYLAESTGSNVFFVKDGVLTTPVPDCFLNGITRLTAIEIAKKLGISFVERHVKPEELETADEVFITGTAIEVHPVVLIGKREYQVGPITEQIAAAYKKMTRGQPYA